VLDDQSPSDRLPFSSLPVPILLLCLALTLLLSGCGTASTTRRTDLHLPLYGPLGSPDPALASTPAGTFLDSLLYSGLVKFGPDMHVVPELAVSLPTISSNGLSYTFTIRQDCHFADGRHCTAADVAYSLARTLNPAVHSRLAHQYFRDIAGSAAVWDGRSSTLTGVQVVHRLTVRVRLIRPDADFLAKLASSVGVVVEQRALHGNQIVDWDRSAGTGAWEITGRGRDGTLLLSRRHHFYGAQTQIRALSLVPVRDAAAGVALYKRGEIDAALIPSGQYGDLAANPEFHSTPGLDAYYAVPSSAAPGLAARLSRDALVRRTSPALTPLPSIVPPAVPDYISSPPQFGTGVSRGHASSIAISRGNPTERALRRALMRQWGPLTPSGTTVRVIHVWHSLPDPSLWLHLVTPETASTWYRHLLARAGTLTNDPVTRMATYSRCETWALQQGLIIPLASGNIAYLIKPYVQNLQVTPMGLMPANNSWAAVSVS
jgi:ABC-type transport system substrate-binding protein